MILKVQKDRIKMNLVDQLGFVYDISAFEGYLMPNPGYIFILGIYM